MSLLPPFKAKQLRQNGQSFYVDEEGDRFPSVSTILNATRPAEQWEALANWRQRVGSEEANRISSAASRRGSGTHKHIERYLKGQDVPCADHVRPYWESLQSVLPDIQDVRLIEGFVFHRELAYAGKADCVASYAGTPCLCEWKTADRPKRKLEHLNDYPLQVAAYWGAVNDCYREQGIGLDHAILVLAIPDMPAEVFQFNADMIAHYWQEWENRVNQFWRRQGGRRFNRR